MRTFLTSAAIALALAGTSLAIATPANADGYSVSVGNNNGRDYGHDYNNGRDYGRNRSGSVISIGFGDVAFGYRDGYWDNGHRWHRWNNSRDYRNYRGQHGNNYHDWNHNRDSNHGWQGH